MFKKTIILVFVVVLFYSLFKIGSYYLDSRDEIKLQKEIESNLQFTAKQEKLVNMKKLQKINKDIFGYIKIPGTSIAYPVVQSDDNDYYLTHNIKGKETNVGSIFLDYRVPLTTIHPHYVLYGHNRKDGTMFHELSNYQREDFTKKHDDVTLYLEKKTLRARVYSVYKANSKNIEMPLSFQKEEMDKYVEDTYARSLYHLDKPKNVKTVITLVTCTNINQEDRWIIHTVVE